MGFLFEPPLEYFEKIFKYYAQCEPKPSIQLFGGEPTVRNDLFDIIRIARKLKLATRLTTNGIRLADEEYCKKQSNLIPRFYYLMMETTGKSMQNCAATVKFWIRK